MLRGYQRSIVEAINRCVEVSTFVPALGYTFARRPVEIEVAHAERTAGQSKYSIYRLIRLNFDLMTGFSVVPLQFFTMAGMALALMSFFFVVVLAVRRLLIGSEVQGVFTLFGIVFFLIGVLLVGLGVVGEYVGRIYEQVRQRPRYTVAAVLEEGEPQRTERRALPEVRRGLHPELDHTEMLRAERARGTSEYEQPSRGRLRLSRRRRPLPEDAVVRADRRASGRHCQGRPQGEPMVRQRRRYCAGVRTTVVDAGRRQWPGVRRACGAAEPDLIFSFYYRSMLGAPLLRAARRGALNMHGSLLPKYRGRAPVNWAILNGERETGATLHYMVERADAGDIVDQLAVPILEDDDALEVFGKVTAAAEIVLARSLPGLLTGAAPRRPQVIEPGQYFGRRRPEDGRIDWSHPAARIHNLVRAVAPPFPGAFTEVNFRPWRIHRTRIESRTIAPSERARLFGTEGACYAACRDGGVLRILAAATEEGPARSRADLASARGPRRRYWLDLGTIALKIDVDTYRGTREGVPRLAAALERAGARATFLFSVGPGSYGPRDQARVSPRIPRQSPPHLGDPTLRGQDPALRRAPPGTAYRAPLRQHHAGSGAARASRWACTPTTTSNGRTVWRGRASPGHGGSWCWRVRSSFGCSIAPPQAHGAAGWQVNGSVPGLEQELGFRYASDTRGRGPFVPVVEGREVAVPQLPTTLPTLDELIGREDLGGKDPVEHLLALTQDGGDQVFTLHAELEGGAYLDGFERLLGAWRARGFSSDRPGVLRAGARGFAAAAMRDPVGRRWREGPGHSRFKGRRPRPGVPATISALRRRLSSQDGCSTA